MNDVLKLLDKITAAYPDLPPKLQIAAEYVLASPQEVAMHSMRGIAARAKVIPNTFLRLARTLGYENYGAFKDTFQNALRRSGDGFGARAQALIEAKHGDRPNGLFKEMAIATRANTSAVFELNTPASFQRAADIMCKARRVYVLGTGCYSVAHHMFYVGRMALADMRLTGSSMMTVVDDFVGLTSEDVVLGITTAPYSRDTMRAANIAIKRKAKLIAIADSRTAPLAGRAKQVLLAPAEGPAFYPSYTAALAVAETLLVHLVAGADEKALKRIRNLDDYRKSEGVYWNPKTSN